MEKVIRLNRRKFIQIAGASAAAGLIRPKFLFSRSKIDKQKPNVLFIIVDDLRAELGCYGSSLVHSPNIDRIARDGLLFSRAYCSKSVCNPSRASLLTGIRPDTLRVHDNNTHFRQSFPKAVTLPQLFKNNGYQCAAIGKIFHGSLPDPISWNRRSPAVRNTPIYMSPKTRARQQKREAEALKAGRSQAWIDAYLRGPATEAFEAPDNLYRDGAVADAAIALLPELQRTEPFFMAVGFSKPHLPFVAPKRYWDLYDREKIPLAQNGALNRGAPRMAINSLTELACHEDFVRVPNPAEGQLTERQARLLRHGYFACISFCDAQIGRILDALIHLGLRENTIVVLVSDHGYKLGEHGSWGKMTNYEIDTRVPLIISAPWLENKGIATPALVELVDVYPTLCELAGLPPPDNLEGNSMGPLFSEPSKKWKKAAFSQYARGFTYRFRGRAIRTDRYRFIEWRGRFSRRVVAHELYDHKNDPLESDNIAGLPQNQVLVMLLSRQLRRGWRAARPR